MRKDSLYSILFAAMTLVVVMAIVLSSVQPVQAAEIRNSGVLNANETIDDDLVLSGDQVRIDGTVNGMLIAAGRTVVLNGTINGDAVLGAQEVIVSDKAVINGNLFTGAQIITVSGEVTGSVTAGAGALVLGGKVGHNVYFGGYSLETLSGNTVARGVYIGAYQAILNGAIARDLNANAGAIELNGSVGGHAQLDVAAPGQSAAGYVWTNSGIRMPPSIASGLRIGPAAKISGQLIYTSQSNQSAAIQAAPAGGVVYQTPVPQQRTNQPIVRPTPPAVTWTVNFLRGFTTLLVLGLLAVWLMPAAARGTGDMLRVKPGPSAGYGLLTILVGYIGAFVAGLLVLGIGIFLALVTLGGLSSTVFGIGFTSLSLLVAIFTLVVSFASKLVIAYLVGDLILAGMAPEMTGRRFWAMALGVLIYSLVRSIPVLGWVVAVIVSIMGVGAIWLYFQSRRAPTAAQLPVAQFPAAPVEPQA